MILRVMITTVWVVAVIRGKNGSEYIRSVGSDQVYIRSGGFIIMTGRIVMMMIIIRFPFLTVIMLRHMDTFFRHGIQINGTHVSLFFFFVLGGGRRPPHGCGSLVHPHNIGWCGRCLGRCGRGTATATTTRGGFHHFQWCSRRPPRSAYGKQGPFLGRDTSRRRRHC